MWPRFWRTRGAVVIDADAVGHELLNEPRVYRQLVERFGNGIVFGKRWLKLD